MCKLFYPLSMLSILLLFSCNARQNKSETERQHTFTGKDGEVQLVVLDPGHFHASLLQKFPQRLVNDTVHVYAPQGDELDQYMASIEGYNQRADNPTHWQMEVYTGEDYLERMIGDEKGNVVILAGNNGKKTRYIHQSICAGYNVLSDKPMAINREGFELLKETYDSARVRDIYLYDVMTERYDIINTLTRELVNNKELFGDLEVGTADEPAITLQSVHHYYKEVSGNVLVRPAWFYDVDQQGEGMVDVATHLVDLVNWQCFPDEIIDYESDIAITSASHWPTVLTLDDFSRSTRLNAFPDFLQRYLNDSKLEVFGNGKINYQVKGQHVSVAVLWNYEAPPGGGDSYNGHIKGTRASVEIVQDGSVDYVKQLFIVRKPSVDARVFEDKLNEVVAELQKSYPYMSTREISTGRYQIVVPVEFRKGHEDYFGMVAQKYFGFLINRDMPQWEISNTLAKYYVTTTALEIAKNEQ